MTCDNDHVRFTACKSGHGHTRYQNRTVTEYES